MFENLLFLLGGLAFVWFAVATLTSRGWPARVLCFVLALGALRIALL